jgi:hypothetical protein
MDVNTALQIVNAGAQTLPLLIAAVQSIAKAHAAGTIDVDVVLTVAEGKFENVITTADDEIAKAQKEINHG